MSKKEEEYEIPSEINEMILHYFWNPVAFVRDILGVEPDIWQEIALYDLAMSQRVAIKAGHGVGKCLCSNDLQALSSGELIKSINLIDKNIKVQSWNEKQDKIETKMASFWDNGLKQCKEITLTNGTTLTRTNNHPLWIARKTGKRNRLGRTDGRNDFIDILGWVNSEDIKIGDCVAEPCSYSLNLPESNFKDSEIKLLAYMIANGQCKTIRFTSGNKTTINDFIYCCKDIGCQVKNPRRYEYSVSGLENGNTLRNLIKNNNLYGHLSYTKFIPQDVFKSSDRQIALFLGCLYDCDGSLYTKEEKGHGFRTVIEYCSVSKELIDGVYYLLLRLGINSNIREKKTSWTHEGIKKYSTAWVCEIRDADNIITFCEKIIVLGKQDKQQEILQLVTQKNNDKKQKWRHLDCPTGFQWTEIKDIKDIECQTVGITVEDNHTFVSHLALEHNSAMESWILWWFMFTRPRCRVVATAPTKTHMFDVLWAECGHWLEKSPVLQKYFEWQKTRIIYKDNPADWFAVAKTASKSEGMAGTHKEDSGVLIIIDEGSGVDSAIIEALEGSINDENCKMLICGNPVKTTGYFKDCFTTDKRFEGHRHTVSCIDSSLVTRKQSDRISYAKGIADKYGQDSNVYRIRVLGLFPKVEDDVFIPIDLYTNALMKHDFYTEGDKAIEKKSKIPNGELQIGVDVARYGGDNTIYTPRVGNIILPQIKRARPQTDIGLMEFAQELYLMSCNMMKTYKQDSLIIVLDDNGVGGGLTDRLHQMFKDNPIEGCTVQIAACNSWNTVNKELERIKKINNKAYIPYYKWGDQMYGHLKDLMMSGELLFYKYSEQLEGELSCRKYSITNGLIKLESKKEMKDRGLKSPDHSDSLMLATAPVNVEKKSSFIEHDEKTDPAYAKYIEMLKKEGTY